MISRRRFAQSFAAAVALGGEAAFAQRPLPPSIPPGAIWLNANENPDGPPPAALEAIREAAPTSGRYHFAFFREVYAAIARSEGLAPEQVLVGAGSSEPLHAAVHAFASPSRPVVVMDPTFELVGAAAEGCGIPVIRVPLAPSYGADVKRMAAEADKNRAGLVYVCNPNNPTSAATPKSEIDWLAENLPRDTVLVVDEAYIHFTSLGSALEHVHKGRNVVVARTFSKIYGMAGLRIGFACARQDLIERMSPFRPSVPSILAGRAVLAVLPDAPKILSERKAKLAAVRKDFCAWLEARKIPYIEPHGNFVMFETGREAREVGTELARRGVVAGRPFPPLTRMLRVTLGTPAEMARFKQVYEEIAKA